MGEVESNFLQHLITLIRDEAYSIPSASKSPTLFDEGRALAYHKVLCDIVECSKIFKISLKSLGVSDIDPDVLI